jgi:UDP-N-acetylmuramate dehydrogenase
MNMPVALVGSLQPNVSLRPFCTLRAGGRAEFFASARNVDELAELAVSAQRARLPVTVLGWGSNVLPSDQGVPGVVVHNATSSIRMSDDGVVEADSGVGFQELFLKCAQSNLAGLEYAVGIPGTVGGALVSNAGAYRSNVSEFLTEIEIAFEGQRQWVSPDWMEFSYRDSKLRRPDPIPCVLLRMRFRLPKDDPKRIYDEARDYQRQRISKQPAPASAGSFFKNVYDAALAQTLTSLPARLRDAGVVPAGYLIQESGLAGARHGGALLASKHANFMINAAGATATEIRQLAGLARCAVRSKFGVELEEEVLYLGDWTSYAEASP